MFWLVIAALFTCLLLRVEVINVLEILFIGLFEQVTAGRKLLVAIADFCRVRIQIQRLYER